MWHVCACIQLLHSHIMHICTCTCTRRGMSTCPYRVIRGPFTCTHTHTHTHREVQVVRLVGRETVEEEILKCAEQKLKLEQDMTTDCKLYSYNIN